MNKNEIEGLPGAVALLLERGEGTPRAFTVFEDERYTGTGIIFGGAREPNLIVREKLRPLRHHTFRTLEGFLAYLNSDDCAKIQIPAYIVFNGGLNDMATSELLNVYVPLVELEAHGIVFVGTAGVTANLAYGQLANQMAYLELEFSEEYAALMRLLAGVSQRELWRLLITALDASIDRALLLSIAQISITPTGVNTVRIDDVDSTDKTVRDSLEITWGGGAKGDKVATIETDWVWTGQVFECFPHVVSINLRLEVQTSENGIQFTFHPRRLDAVLRGTRNALVERLQSGVPKHISVYEGQE